MDQIEHLLKQTDSNNKIAGLIIAIDYLNNKTNNNDTNQIQQDLEKIYQSMGRKFLFKLLSAPLFKTKNDEQKINDTSLTCYNVAISITNTMIEHHPLINNQIIAGIIPLLTNITIQIISYQKKHFDQTLNSLNHLIINTIFNILQCYHNMNKNNNNNKLIRFYKAIKSNHYNQKNAENGNIYSMTMTLIKCLSIKKNNNDKNNIIDNKKLLKSMELMILYCKNPNNEQNKSLIIAQKIFIKSLINCYKNCETKLKFEFPKIILSIFYHLFEQKQTMLLHEYLMEIRNICIGSLGSRMYLNHRLDIFKLIEMSLIFEGYEWLIIDQDKHKFFKKMSSEKLFLFLTSCISNEIRINLETKPSWNIVVDESKNNEDPHIIYHILDINLNILNKLISYIISDDNKIDSWITTFKSNTLHSIQQNIHNGIRALFFYITELKHAVFQKQNTLKLNDNNKEIEKNQKLKEINDKFKELSMDDILNKNTLKLLDRILYGILLYFSDDFITFIDEFCSVLPFILGQFGHKYIGTISNILSKMLTNNVSESKEDDKKYKNMIITELYKNNFISDILIGQCLNKLSLKLSNGFKYEISELFEIENEMLSVSLLIYDVFIMNEMKFKSLLFDQDNINNSKFETLFEIIYRIGNGNDKIEIILPIIVMTLKIINQTSDKKLNKFGENQIKFHIDNLVKIASMCQKFEHVWIDEIAMNLMQLKTT